MSKADEMFKELGYEKIEEDEAYKRNEQHIVFYFPEREVVIYKRDKEGLGIDYIDMQELKAINMKCKELGWEV